MQKGNATFQRGGKASRGIHDAGDDGDGDGDGDGDDDDDDDDEDDIMTCLSACWLSEGVTGALIGVLWP